MPTLSTQDKKRIQEYLRSAKWIAGANTAGDVEKLVEYGFDVPDEWVDGSRVLDAILLSRMVDENEESYELESQLLAHHNVPPWKHETEPYNWVIEETDGKKRKVRRVDAARWPSELRRKRCRLDAWAGRINCQHFAYQYFAKQPSPRKRLLVEFTHRVASAVSRLTLSGMVVDMAVFEKLGSELERDMLAARDQLQKAAIAAGMQEFSPSNDGHIRELLYKRLGLPILETTKKEGLPCVDKDTLKQLDNPVVEMLLRYNAAEKLFSTNVEGLRDFLLPIGYLQGSPSVPVSLLPVHLNPLGARTGRRSSSNPNVQNWAKRIRGIIRSRHPDGGVVGAFDYEKLEPRILGWLAKEPFLLSVFGPGGGGYIVIAKHMWGFEPISGSPEYRATKSIVLGVHYCMETEKMAHQLWVLGVRFSADYEAHWRETDRLRRKYLALIPNVVRYMERQEDELLRTQQIVAPSGQVRHLPCPDGQRTRGYTHMRNQAVNYPVQETASKITGAALVGIERELLREYGLSYREYLSLLLEGRKKLLTNGAGCGIITPKIASELYPFSLPINEVHDEITVDIPPHTRARDYEIIVETMRSVPDFHALVPGFDAPLSVDPLLSRHWHVKEE
jgi:DNA polymerase I-like protein with 3'-5' exonuclease and polymerase domains